MREKCRWRLTVITTIVLLFCLFQNAQPNSILSHIQSFGGNSPQFQQSETVARLRRNTVSAKMDTVSTEEEKSGESGQNTSIRRIFTDAQNLNRSFTYALKTRVSHKTLAITEVMRASDAAQMKSDATKMGGDAAKIESDAPSVAENLYDLKPETDLATVSNAHDLKTVTATVADLSNFNGAYESMGTTVEIVNVGRTTTKPIVMGEINPEKIHEIHGDREHVEVISLNTVAPTQSHSQISTATDISLTISTATQPLVSTESEGRTEISGAKLESNSENNSADSSTTAAAVADNLADQIEFIGRTSRDTNEKEMITISPSLKIHEIYGDREHAEVFSITTAAPTQPQPQTTQHSSTQQQSQLELIQHSSTQSQPTLQTSSEEKAEIEDRLKLSNEKDFGKMTDSNNEEKNSDEIDINSTNSLNWNRPARVEIVAAGHSYTNTPMVMLKRTTVPEGLGDTTITKRDTIFNKMEDDRSDTVSVQGPATISTAQASNVENDVKGAERDPTVVRSTIMSGGESGAAVAAQSEPDSSAATALSDQQDEWRWRSQFQDPLLSMNIRSEELRIDEEKRESRKAKLMLAHSQMTQPSSEATTQIELTQTQQYTQLQPEDLMNPQPQLEDLMHPQPEHFAHASMNPQQFTQPEHAIQPEPDHYKHLQLEQSIQPHHFTQSISNDFLHLQPTTKTSVSPKDNTVEIKSTTVLTEKYNSPLEHIVASAESTTVSLSAEVGKTFSKLGSTVTLAVTETTEKNMKSKEENKSTHEKEINNSAKANDKSKLSEKEESEEGDRENKRLTTRTVGSFDSKESKSTFHEKEEEKESEETKKKEHSNSTPATKESDETSRQRTTRAELAQSQFDPHRPADPSLETVTLSRPDYRKVSSSTTTTIAPTVGSDNDDNERNSATIMQMGGSDDVDGFGVETDAQLAPATTESASTTTAEPTTILFEGTTSLPSITEQTIKPTIPELELFTSTVSAQADDNNNGRGTVIVMDDDYSSNGDTLRALQKALHGDLSSGLRFQNVTVVLPNFDPPPDALFDALIANRAREPSPTAQGGYPPAYAPQYLPPQNLPVVNRGIPNGVMYDPRRLQGGYGMMDSGHHFSNTVHQPKTQTALATVNRSDVLIEPNNLNELLRTRRRLRLLDASYEPEGTTVDPTAFRHFHYAKWDELMREKKGHQYRRSHIPGAIHFNLNIATYPTWNDRQALYPADLFEEYVQRLGINDGDEIVVYARGPMGGMLHAARVWALFRIYGHEDIRILNGGLNAWRKAALPTTLPARLATNSSEERGEEQRRTRGLGNWTAFFNSALTVTFEELSTPQSDGYCVFSRLVWYNFLDARPRNEFFGMTNHNRQYGMQAVDSYGGGDATRIQGTKPFPADELVDPTRGLMIDNAEILKKLHAVGYAAAHQTIAAGNTADEASLVILALKLVGDTTAKLYNGGMEEIRRRAPQLISA